MKRLIVLMVLLSLPLRAAELAFTSPDHEVLGPAPTAPSVEFIATLPKSRPRPMDLTGNYGVVTTNREESRNLFNAVHAASVGVPSGWNGNVSNCVAGTTSATFKEAVLRRINYFRAMAGLPSSATFDATFSANVQQAALMMSANNALSHAPTNTWFCFSLVGSNAAANANIALGSFGPTSVDGYIRDSQANNTAVGHRRWLLYPQTQLFGSGDVPAAGSLLAANAIWVFDGNFGGPRPGVRDGFVAWPPPGFVPNLVVYSRWSFSFPGANFVGTTVSVTSNGIAITAPIEALAANIGEPTIVFRPGSRSGDSDVPYTAPAADTVYQVTLNNVVIGGHSSNFTYRVTVFDPSVKGPDSVEPTISGPGAVAVGTNANFTFNAVAKVTGYQTILSLRTNLTAVEGAETGLGGVISNTSGLYPVIVSDITPPSGTRAFHLAHPAPNDQILQINRTVLVRSGGQLQFQSRLGWAAGGQMAKVQVSQNGASWQDVDSQAGSGGSGEGVFTLRTVPLTSFTNRSIQAEWEHESQLVKLVPLTSFTNRSIQVRFNYISTGGYFFDVDSDVGWLIDDVAFTNCDDLSAPQTNSLAVTTNASVAFSQAGSFTLQIRPIVYGAFGLETGPAKLITAAASSRITNLIGPSGNNTLLLLRKPDGSAFSAGDVSLFEVQAATNLANPVWNALGTPVLSNGYLRVLDTASPVPPVKFYRVLSK